MIGIIGNGVIGNIVALHLSQNQIPWQWCDLRALPRSQQLQQDQQRTNGVVIQRPEAASSIKPITVTAPVQQHLNGCQLIIICCKSYQLEALSQQLARHLSPELPVLLIHNGMLDPHPLMRLERSAPTYLGIASMAGYNASTANSISTEPFDKTIVRVNAGRLEIGPLPNHNTDKRHVVAELQNIVSQLTPTEVIIRQDIRVPMYIKLAVNACINLPCSWHDVKNGELTEQPALTSVVARLAAEIAQLYQHLGLDTETLSEQNLYEQAINIAIQTGNNSCSMREDIRHQRLTEVDSISGYLLTLAQQHALTLPCLSLYHQRIKRLEVSYCS